MKKTKGYSTAQVMLLTGVLATGGSGAYIASTPSSEALAQQSMNATAKMFQDIESAALNDYYRNNAWSSSLNDMKDNNAYFGDMTSPYGTAFTTTANADGSLTIASNVATATQASQLANIIGNGTVVGLQVSKRIGTPAEGALRNTLLRDYIDVNNSGTQLTFQRDVNMNGNQIVNATNIESTNVVLSSGNANGIRFPTSSISENTAGQLDVVTSNANFSQNMTVAGSVNATSMDITNEINAALANIAQIDSTNATLNTVTSDVATLTQADIDQLVANNANLRNATVDTLNVSGLTTLANVVAEDANFNGMLTSQSLNITGQGVVQFLESQNIEVQNANISRAEVESLMATLADIQQLTSTVANIQELTADTAVITALESTSGIFEHITAEIVTATELDVETFRAVNSELEQVTAQTLEVLGEANFTTLIAETATIGTANVETVNAVTLNTQDANVTGTVTTEQLQVNSNLDTQTLAVAGTLTTNDLEAQNARITGTLTSNDVISENVTVDNNVTASNLNVTGEATLADVNAQTVSTGNATVSGALTTRNLTVSQTAEFNSDLQVNDATATNVTVNDTLTTNSLTASSANIGTATADRLTASDFVNTRDLVVTALASLQRATIDNLTATTANLRSVEAQTVNVTGTLTAASAEFRNLTVLGQATFNNVDVNGNMTLNGPLTVNGDLTAQTITARNTLTAQTINAGNVNTRNANFTGNATANDFRTTNGLSLRNLQSQYVAHNGRILTMEQWIAACKEKEVAECNR